jgi:hypothetical protein
MVTVVVCYRSAGYPLRVEEFLCELFSFVVMLMDIGNLVEEGRSVRKIN